MERLTDCRRCRDQQGKQGRIGLTPPTELPAGESDGDQRRTQRDREGRPGCRPGAMPQDQPSRRHNQQSRQDGGPNSRANPLVDHPGPEVGLAYVARKPAQSEHGQVHLQESEAVGQPHRNGHRRQSRNRKDEDDNPTNTPGTSSALDPGRRPRQHRAPAQPCQPVKRVVDPQFPRSQMRGKVLDQVDSKARPGASQRPGLPRQRSPRPDRACFCVAPADPGRDQSAECDPDEYGHLTGCADPKPNAARDAGDEEPAPRPFTRMRRLRIRCADPGQQGQHAPQRKSPHQPLIARLPRQEPRSERENGRQSD